MAAKKYRPNDRLRHARELRGWGQQDLAERLDVPETRTIRRWERGESLPTPCYRQRLCEVFGLNAEELGLLEPAPMHPSLPAIAQENTLPARPRDKNRQRLLNKVGAFWNRYEDLLALHLADRQRVQARLKDHKQVILAIEHDLPDVGQEVFWVLRDSGSGELLLARNLVGATEDDLTHLLEEMVALCQEGGVPIAGVISDGQHSLREAVARVLPGISHELHHVHAPR